jgi:hypothetical protein
MRTDTVTFCGELVILAHFYERSNSEYHVGWSESGQLAGMVHLPEEMLTSVVVFVALVSLAL